MQASRGAGQERIRPAPGWLAVLVLLAGCAMLVVPQEAPRPSPLAPVWSEGELEEHLRAFNGREADGRATGTSGYARVAEYVAARMGELRLQPVLDRSYRMVYQSSINYPTFAAIHTGAPDSTLFLPGIDFLPHGVSDSGRVQLRTFVVAPDPSAVRRGDGVLLREGEASVERLRALRDAGAAAVAVVRPLRPSLHAAPVERLLVVQVTADAAAQLLQTTPEVLGSALARPGSRLSLTRPVYLRVATSADRRGGALNVMGYIPGEHPVHARELVLLCADLDAMGHMAGVQAIDFEHFGVGAAALLETARNLSHMSRYWTMPERTILVSVWSGARLGHTGLRAFLEHPAWDLRRIRAVVYVGLDEADRASVEALLAPHGIPLRVVPPPEEPLHDVPAVLLPDPAQRRLARAMGRRVPPAMAVDLNVVLQRAVLGARTLADAAYAAVLRESVTGEPALPNLPDTLRRPPTAPL